MAKKICLDAGHYAKSNRSPAVPEYYESDMNWKLHLLLKKELESYGFQVTQTRSAQANDLELYARGAASKGSDLFLSLHSNAVADGVDENTDYPVVIVQLDGRGDVLGEKLAECVESVMGTKGDGRTWTRKGNNGEYYGVLRGAAAVGTMGMIIEHSFHTNTRSTKWLLQDSNLAKLAAAEAKVIAEHYGMSKKTANTESDAAAVIYRVQVGAFSVKENEEAMMAKVKAAGFKDAFITTSGATAAATAPTKKSVDELAREVLAGEWGSGADRKEKLTAAGYDYAAIQKRVNELLKG